MIPAETDVLDTARKIAGVTDALPVSPLTMSIALLVSAAHYIAQTGMSDNLARSALQACLDERRAAPNQPTITSRSLQ